MSVYVSQIVTEIPYYGVANVYVSQVVAEVLTIGTDAVRVSQFVVEVLVPNIEVPPYVTFPTYPTLKGLSYSVFKRPNFSTGKGTSASGREVRIQYFSSPRWEWDLTYEYLPDAQLNGSTASDLKTFMGFYLSVAGGTLPFLFLDPDDNYVTSQLIATGDGSTNTFTLVRSYGLGSNIGTEPIGYLNTAKPFNVYVNGSLMPNGSYSVNQTTGGNQLLVFTSAPAASQPITVDMGYFYVVTFKDDNVELEKFVSDIWSLKKTTLISQKA